jgi:hypothetical protein
MGIWKAQRIFVEKFLGKLELERQRKWKYNIEVGLRETECEDWRLMELVQDNVQ